MTILELVSIKIYKFKLHAVAYVPSRGKVYVWGVVYVRATLFRGLYIVSAFMQESIIKKVIKFFLGHTCTNL